eukprot:gene22832-27594_t
MGRTFGVLALSCQTVILIGFGVLGEAKFTAESSAHSVQVYNYYVGVALMMLVGFGYLMTFLRWYGLGAVGFTMLITCISVEVAILAEPLFANGWEHKINVDVMSLLHGNFCAAACLISFGGVIGKLNPSQLLVLAFVEPIFYSMNNQLVLTTWLGIADVGGTISIHMFGAYFGLAVSAVHGKPVDTSKEKSSTVSDIFSFIGTTFLWLFWPSFVAGAIPAGTPEAETAITNTVLALIASTVMTFAVSPLLCDGVFRPVDLQNATLAGGVAIGAIANLDIKPIGALLVGSFAGALSTVGFCRVQEALLTKLQLHDSCGIHNLHGLPSILGGLASAIVPTIISDDNAGHPGKQLAGVAVTLVVAVTSGALSGFALKTLNDDARMADDSFYWEVADDFDKGL